MVAVSGVLGLVATAILVAGLLADGATAGALFYVALAVSLVAAGLLPLGAARQRRL